MEEERNEEVNREGEDGGGEECRGDERAMDMREGGGDEAVLRDRREGGVGRMDPLGARGGVRTAGWGEGGRRGGDTAAEHFGHRHRSCQSLDLVKPEHPPCTHCLQELQW